MTCHYNIITVPSRARPISCRQSAHCNAVHACRCSQHSCRHPGLRSRARCQAVLPAYLLALPAHPSAGTWAIACMLSHSSSCSSLQRSCGRVPSTVVSCCQAGKHSCTTNTTNAQHCSPTTETSKPDTHLAKHGPIKHTRKHTQADAAPPQHAHSAAQPWSPGRLPATPSTGLLDAATSPAAGRMCCNCKQQQRCMQGWAPGHKAASSAGGPGPCGNPAPAN
jgi:hypothetical protein